MTCTMLLQMKMQGRVPSYAEQAPVSQSSLDVAPPVPELVESRYPVL